MIKIFSAAGVELFSVYEFKYTETDMGESNIELELKLSADVTHEFDLRWYVVYKGEKFYLRTKKPQGNKDTTSLLYTYTLLFRSQREDLKRYTFLNFTDLGDNNSTNIPNSYDFTFYGTITEFKDRFNLNCTYYFGANVWQMIISDNYTVPEGNITVNCSNASLWDMLLQVYELFGVRWKIVSLDSVMTVMVAYPDVVLSHLFDYRDGLTSIERVNPYDDIYTRMRGKGSSRNLPVRYFKNAMSNSSFAGDPDANALLANMYYANLMPTVYRDYIRGWNYAEIGGAFSANETAAWQQGWNDYTDRKPINPVDYVESNVDKWGVIYGTLENNEEIYPTIQGVVDDNLGRIDEVVDVEVITNDDWQSNANLSYKKEGWDEGLDEIGNIVFVVNKVEPVTCTTPISTEFEVEDDDTVILFNATQCAEKPGNHVGCGITSIITITLVDTNDTIIKETVITNSGNFTGGSSVQSIAWSPYSVIWMSVPAGSYTVNVTITGQITSSSTRVPIINLTTNLTNLDFYKGDIYENGRYKETFNVWIKDIGFDPSDEQYWSTEDMAVMFSDGMLAGEDYQFTVVKGSIEEDISKSLNGVPSKYRMTLKKSDAELEASGRYLPNIMQNAIAGNHFFFINIELPHSYVVNAEERLQVYMTEELEKVDDEYPTYTVVPSKIFCDSFNEVSDLRAGNKIKLYNAKLVSVVEELYIQTLTVTYAKDSILPTWEMVVTDKIAENRSTISLLQAQIQQLNNSYQSYSLTFKQTVDAFTRYFLRKDGLSDTSYSDTLFKKNITIEGDIKSNDYREGGFAGAGFGIYNDINQQRTIEVDNLVVRRQLNVNELVINQITFYGGKQIFSAAGMVADSVKEFASYYRCYLDTKGGTVLNQFVLNDQAYCQRYDPQSNDIIKYYWRLVVGVGLNYIDLSKFDADGDGVPAAGDNIAQIGHRSNVARQSIFEINQLNGGSIIQYAGISGYNFVNKDYVGYGVDASTGKAYFYVYGTMHIGDRPPFDAASSYMEYDADNGLVVAGKIVIKANSYGYGNLLDKPDLEQYLTNTDGMLCLWWNYDYMPTTSNLPASAWTTDDLKNEHVGDLFWYDQIQRWFRFTKTETTLVNGDTASSNITWSWERINPIPAWFSYFQYVDSNNATARATRVYSLATPSTPYSVGDIWLNGAIFMRCTTSRLNTEEFQMGDWDDATIYDKTKTVIDGGLVTTGSIQLVGENNQVHAGITGDNSTSDEAIWLWGGSTMANKVQARTRFYNSGRVEMSNKQQNRVTKFTQDKIPTLAELLETSYTYVQWGEYGYGYIYNVLFIPDSSVQGDLYEVTSQKISDSFNIIQDASLVLRLECTTSWSVTTYDYGLSASILTVKVWRETTLYKEYSLTKSGLNNNGFWNLSVWETIDVPAGIYHIELFSYMRIVKECCTNNGYSGIPVSIGARVRYGWDNAVMPTDTATRYTYTNSTTILGSDGLASFAGVERYSLLSLLEDYLWQSRGNISIKSRNDVYRVEITDEGATASFASGTNSGEFKITETGLALLFSNYRVKLGSDGFAVEKSVNGGNYQNMMSIGENGAITVCRDVENADAPVCSEVVTAVDIAKYVKTYSMVNTGTLTAAEHGKGMTPQVQLLDSGGELVYPDYSINASGDITWVCRSADNYTLIIS